MKPVLVLLKIIGLIYPTTMAFSATNHRLYLSARAPVLRAAEAHPQSPLDITRPLRDDLRQRTIDTISTLHAPAKAALARERSTARLAARAFPTDSSRPPLRVACVRAASAGSTCAESAMDISLAGNEPSKAPRGVGR